MKYREPDWVVLALSCFMEVAPMMLQAVQGCAWHHAKASPVGDTPYLSAIPQYACMASTAVCLV